MNKVMGILHILTLIYEALLVLLSILYGCDITNYTKDPLNIMGAPDMCPERMQLLGMVAAALSFCPSPSTRAALYATYVDSAARLGRMVTWQPLWSVK